MCRKKPFVASLAQGRLRHIARLAQIPFGFAQGRLSLRKERLLGMTIQLRQYWMSAAFDFGTLSCFRG